MFPLIAGCDSQRDILVLVIDCLAISARDHGWFAILQQVDADAAVMDQYVAGMELVLVVVQLLIGIGHIAADQMICVDNGLRAGAVARLCVAEYLAGFQQSHILKHPADKVGTAGAGLVQFLGGRGLGRVTVALVVPLVLDHVGRDLPLPGRQWNPVSVCLGCGPHNAVHSQACLVLVSPDRAVRLVAPDAVRLKPNLFYYTYDCEGFYYGKIRTV